ncbi:MAG: ABC transporter substrate-binding protein [Micromonosporaceae bacterium]
MRHRLRMIRPQLLAAALTALALLSGGVACGSSGKGSGATNNSPAAAFPVTVGSLTLTQQPQRIVSLSPTATEMLFAIDAGKQVVAVDDQSNYPAAAPKTDLSGFKPNAEAIAAKNPDLVVLANDIDKIVDQLATLKIPTYLAPAANVIDDTYRQINDLGKLTGHRGEASMVVDRMSNELDKLVEDAPAHAKQLTYYYELDPTLYTVTSKTFIGSVFASVGLVNVADGASKDDNQYPQLSPEVLVQLNPDMIFLADSKCCAQSKQTVSARAGWSGITAVKAGQVFPLDDDIASRWGPRVVDLLRAVVEATAKVPAS